MIRDLILEFNFDLNKKGTQSESKVEKQDDTLPDISVVIKTFPVVQKNNLAHFPEANTALKIIQDEIDEDYKLDHQGCICLFEMGYRDIKDPRLEFEKFLHNLTHISKSF